MPTAVPTDTETPPAPKPERRVLALAVGVWWVQRLLKAARPRRPAGDDDEPKVPAPATR